MPSSVRRPSQLSLLWRMHCEPAPRSETPTTVVVEGPLAPSGGGRGVCAARRVRTGVGISVRAPARAGSRLVQRYGDDWQGAVRLISADRSLGDPVVAGLPVLNVELELARSREMAITDEDVFVRRTRLTTLGAPVRPLPGSARE